MNGLDTVPRETHWRGVTSEAILVSLRVVCDRGTVLKFVVWTMSAAPKTATWLAGLLVILAVILHDQASKITIGRCYALVVALRCPRLTPASAASWDKSISKLRIRSMLRQTADEVDIDTNEKNSRYLESLIVTLRTECDKYIISGSYKSRERIKNIYHLIQQQSLRQQKHYVDHATRLISRAGIPGILLATPVVSNRQPSATELGTSDTDQRQLEAAARKQWEDGFSRENEDRSDAVTFSQRFNADKNDLQRQMNQMETGERTTHSANEPAVDVGAVASMTVSQLIAEAGSGDAFTGNALGIGGLDEVLSEIRRRVWIPLAAPPQLLQELGIQPVRGILLYGRSGCGKTLLASKLGRILSPLRPSTIVSGPQIMDRFVGSSEQNLRQIFDNPPPIVQNVSSTAGHEPLDISAVLNKVALHVIIMDEFDAIARTRGGQKGKGDQSDAGVARDSVVNQLLALMDGVNPPVVPTLVIGLTNKRSLIDPALRRPGRFEVQIEVPPPTTIDQRVSILRVHTRGMMNAGRLLTSDAPSGSRAHGVAARLDHDIKSYSQLLHDLASLCSGFSGAALAGLCRSASSHALERAVEAFAQLSQLDSSSPSKSPPEQKYALLNNCVVTWDDFLLALPDIQRSMSNEDFAGDSHTTTDNEALNLTS
jgi:energy-coupling factor transporter ATP-binding protein EcfA2